MLTQFEKFPQKLFHWKIWIPCWEFSKSVEMCFQVKCHKEMNILPTAAVWKPELQNNSHLNGQVWKAKVKKCWR